LQLQLADLLSNSDLTSRLSTNDSNNRSSISIINSNSNNDNNTNSNNNRSSFSSSSSTSSTPGGNGSLESLSRSNNSANTNARLEQLEATVLRLSVALRRAGASESAVQECLDVTRRVPVLSLSSEALASDRYGGLLSGLEGLEGLTQAQEESSKHHSKSKAAGSPSSKEVTDEEADILNNRMSFVL